MKSSSAEMGLSELPNTDTDWSDSSPWPLRTESTFSPSNLWRLGRGHAYKKSKVSFASFHVGFEKTLVYSFLLLSAI
jgi:hypothetical protein